MLQGFIPFASPWWVNLLLLVPPAVFFWFRRPGLKLSLSQLAFSAAFGIMFGLVEAAVVVYLRAAIGLLTGSPAPEILANMPRGLITTELLREAATMFMLLCVALLAAPKARERTAVFLWTFAFWDIFYYFWLRLTIGWPASFTAPDVLFLLPVPWLAQVWFPVLVSALTALAVLLSRTVRRAGRFGRGTLLRDFRV